MTAEKHKKIKNLWIGGTSGLARTYMNSSSFDEWILLGHQQTPPEWMPSNVQYYKCDLTDTKPTTPAFMDKLKNVEQIVISIRPPLLSSLTNADMNRYCDNLVTGLKIFLHALIAQNDNIQSILHISSVAAANHLEAQHFVSLDKDSLVSSGDLTAPYDVFKRACEEIVESLDDTLYTMSLRLSAIFSDDASCIQCQALGIQSRIGSYLPQCIDCNSSRNVAAAIRLVLSKQRDKKLLHSHYYYTRPASQYPQPCPYGEYLSAYRRAYDLWCFIWLPVWIVRCFVETVHWLASRIKIPYIESVDYLLQVSYRDHCFDNSAFLEDFPDIANQEETIEECFRRRRMVLSY